MNELEKVAYNPRTGKKLIYNDKWHTYRVVEDNINLVSSTTFIKKFFPKFDSDKWSKIIANRDGLTQEQVLKKWKDKANASSAFGTETHEYAESLLKHETPMRTKSPRVKAVRETLRDCIDIILEEWEPIGIEKIVFNDCIAGTMDVLFKHRYDEKRYMIGDWKTNEKIEQNNKYNEFGLFQIKHIPNINYYHYALQLSLYRTILLEEGYIEKGSNIELRLYHIKPFAVIPYDMPYLKKEIDYMLSTL